MALFTEERVKANLRNKDGRRVFYLAAGDRLTPSAREWLRREHIEILAAEEAKPAQFRTLSGGILLDKPEHMTHLQWDLLVPKDHPRIIFRGWLDVLQSEFLLAERKFMDSGRKDVAEVLRELLNLFRTMMRCDVLNEPLKLTTIVGLTLEDIRLHSQLPQRFYDQPHFMPEATDSAELLAVNRLRAMVRQCELAACHAFQDKDGALTRTDFVQALNRASSVLWILEIRMKKEADHGSKH